MLVSSQENKNQLYFSKNGLFVWGFFFLWFVPSLFHNVLMLRELDSVVVRNLIAYMNVKEESRSFLLEILYCRIVWSRVFLHSKISMSLRDLIRTNPHAWQWSAWFPSCSSVKCCVLGRQWNSLMLSFFPLASEKWQTWLRLYFIK